MSAGGSVDGVVLRFDDAGAITKRYLNGPAADQVLAEEWLVNSLASSNRVVWGLADHLGTVRDVINNVAVLKSHLTYDAFGRVTAETGTTIDYLAGFAGMFRNDTGLLINEQNGFYFTDTRIYDARTGKWVHEDWIGFAGGDANLARMVGNSVTNATDPTGQMPANWLWWLSGPHGNDEETPPPAEGNKRPVAPSEDWGRGPGFAQDVLDYEDTIDAHFRYGVPLDAVVWEIANGTDGRSQHFEWDVIQQMQLNDKNRLRVEVRQGQIANLCRPDHLAIGAAQGSLNVANGTAIVVIRVGNASKNASLIGRFSPDFPEFNIAKDVIVKDDPLQEFGMTLGGESVVFLVTIGAAELLNSARLGSQVVVNLGGEGEVVGVINQNGRWILDPAWKSSRTGQTLRELQATGHQFVVMDNAALGFKTECVDTVLTNSVPIDTTTWLGPGVQSSEVVRILRSGGMWIRDGKIVYVKP